jgi:hypothetical protein
MIVLILGTRAARLNRRASDEIGMLRPRLFYNERRWCNWGQDDAEIARDHGGHGPAERAGREPRLGTIVKLARALAYPPCEVLAGI